MSKLGPSFQKAVIERAMGADMNLHLVYRLGESKLQGQADERNGANGIEAIKGLNDFTT